MPLLEAAKPLAKKGFERGIDRESPRTQVKDGGYEDAQNILLSNPATGGKHAFSTYLDTPLDAAAAWPSGVSLIWCAPFTDSTYTAATQSLVFNTHVLFATDAGQYARYTQSTDGTPGAVVNVRRGLLGANREINHFAYDKWLCTEDGRNAPMKYGQHFLWGSQLDPGAYLFPIGSRPISPMTGTTVGETWVHSGGNEFRADTFVPQGARVSAGALMLVPGGVSTLTFSYAATLDYTAAPKPYGGDTFLTTDFLVASFVGQTIQKSTGGITIQFTTSAGNYFTFTLTPNVDNTGWVTKSVARSTAVSTGAPNWASIASIQITNTDPSVTVFIDDFYFLYQNAPPAFQVATTHKTRVVAGGAPVGSTPGEPFLSTLVWSNAGAPDNFPSANIQNISGGFEALARTNYIASLREYIDTVIIGTPQAIFSWTIGDTGNPVKSTLSTEHGIDSHRGIVETPSGSLIFPWQRGLYILRSTGRQYIGAKIEPILFAQDGGVFSDAPQWWMSVVDEKTKTVRICYRAGSTDPGHNTNGIVFDYVRAQAEGESVFPSRFTQVFDFAVPAYVNGNRETLYVKSGSNQIHRLHQQASGTLQSFVTLSWTSLDSQAFTDHWVGASFPYASSVPVDVYVRYANNPGEFDSATFEFLDTLPAHPDMAEEARVILGGNTQWMQLKVQAAQVGFELYPPVQVFGFEAERPA